MQTPRKAAASKTARRKKGIKETKTLNEGTRPGDPEIIPKNGPVLHPVNIKAKWEDGRQRTNAGVPNPALGGNVGEPKMGVHTSDPNTWGTGAERP